MRVTGGMVAILALTCATLSRAAAPSAALFPSQSTRDGPRQEIDQSVAPVLGSIAGYEGLIIHSVELKGAVNQAQNHLQDAIPLHAGQPLERDALRQSIQALYATGRFADIQVEADREGHNQVDLTFIVSPNYFVGDMRAEGMPYRPSANQIVDAAKLQLGELYTQDKMDRGLSNIQRLLQQEGYYQAVVTAEQKLHEETQQVDIVLHVTPGPHAHVGQVFVTGDAGYSQGQIQDIAKLHPDDPISSDRVSRALQRVRKRYQKQNRLVAQVALAERKYRPDRNLVDYTFQINRGPLVDLAADGFKIRQGVLKKNVPIYEEGALDDDLLNEGRRNLLDYLQNRGYFDAKIGIKKQSQSAQKLDVVYVIDPGPRHKLLKLEIKGNHYFDEQMLRSHMQVQAAGRFFSHGRFSQKMLAQDMRTLQDLYRANGFRETKISSTLDDNYLGVKAQIAVILDVDEGPQTLVAEMQISGNKTIPADQLPVLSTAVGQPFSESNIASDRDSILNYYFNHGFPNASFEAAFEALPDQPNRMNVSFTVKEGEQFFVNQVLLSGLNYTRPYVVKRELRVEPETPLSQQDMLDTQRHLYDLGIFNQVNTAVQNPEGTEPNKNVLVDTQEAKRYTFDYGFGLEFQTGQPSVGTNQPQGETGVSPRISLGVNRINFRGRDQTISLKGNLGRLQQRGLISFDAPKWLRPSLRLSLTAFYDDTVDVTTFTSQRLEGSAQIEESFSRVNTLIYRYTFRRVKATNVVVASDQIPLLSQPVRVGIPGFTYIRDKRDNPLDATKGNYTTADAGLAGSFFGSEADFGRLLVQNATYQPFGKNRPSEKKYVFARSTTIGIENPFSNTLILNPGESVPQGKSLIPLPERFFSGGGNSHRGFALNQAGPRDPSTGFPLGGSALFLNSLELRMPPLNLPYVQDNVSLAIFHDAGNVFTAAHNMAHSFLNWRQPNQSLCQQQSTADQCSYNYISQAVGIGVRYRTPIGPVRFDFGYNLNPPAFPSFQTIDNKQVFIPQRLTHFNVFFSLGQTF